MNKEDLLEELSNEDKFSLDYSDLCIWLAEYLVVELEVGTMLDKVKDRTISEQIDYILNKLHHNNAYDICSDTSTEPIEYIDFNYGNLTCTISFYDREVGELLPTFDGYIRRDNIELNDCFTDVKVSDVKELIKSYIDKK